MSTKHTPGPWMHDDDGLIYANGAIIADPNCESSQILDIDEREANARLIAKAPELLDALEHLLHEADYENLETAGKRKARALIAEIEGATK